MNTGTWYWVLVLVIVASMFLVAWIGYIRGYVDGYHAQAAVDELGFNANYQRGLNAGEQLTHNQTFGFEILTNTTLYQGNSLNSTPIQILTYGRWPVQKDGCVTAMGISQPRNEIGQWNCTILAAGFIGNLSNTVRT